MKRLVSAISDATIREQREVTVTGHLIGDYASGADRTLIIQVPADAEIEIGAPR